MPENDRKENKEYERDKRRASRDLEYITQEEAREIAIKAAKEELVNLFKQLGIDINNYTDVRQLNENFSYVQQSKSTNYERKSSIFKSLITSVVGGIVGLLTSAVIWFVTHNKP